MKQAINQINATKKAVLTRTFRGELGTNDPIYENAEELLKRVLERYYKKQHARH